MYQCGRKSCRQQLTLEFKENKEERHLLHPSALLIRILPQPAILWCVCVSGYVPVFISMCVCVCALCLCHPCIFLQYNKPSEVQMKPLYIPRQKQHVWIVLNLTTASGNIILGRPRKPAKTCLVEISKLYNSWGSQNLKRVGTDIAFPQQPQHQTVCLQKQICPVKSLLCYR